MPIKSKADLEKLVNVSPEDKADILTLFDSVEKNNAEIAKLKSKQDDADKVAQRQPELEKLLAEKSKLSESLQAKLDALTIKSPEGVQPNNFDDLLPFAEIRADLESFFSFGESGTGEQ